MSKSSSRRLLSSSVGNRLLHKMVHYHSTKILMYDAILQLESLPLQPR
jgi:hypothetical protein